MSAPAAAFSAYRTGISWQTTRTRSASQPCQPVEGLGVAERSGVEALAAGERLLAAQPPLYLAVAGERLTVELADLDVVEPGLDLDRDLPVAERQLGRLTCAREPGMDAEVELGVRELGTEQPRLVATALGERNGHGRIAVHAALQVQHGLGVPGEEDDQEDS